MIKKITAPLLDRLTLFHREDNLTYLTKASKELLAKLVIKVNQIKPYYDHEGQKKWKLWFTVPRGEIEDFGNYKELHAMGEYKTRYDFVKAWKEAYPEENCWYELMVVTDRRFTGLWVDNAYLIKQDLDVKEEHYPDTDYKPLLNFLNDAVDRIVELIKIGRYDKFIDENLPYRYRYGLINRGRLWELDPERKKVDIEKLTEDDIADLVYNVFTDGEEERTKPEGRIKEMTAEKYYEICSYCYIAAEFKDLQGKTPREMFVFYGDDRDGGMSKLPGDDSKAFDEWYELDNQKKWEINNPSHMWEIRCGHTYTMIHLYLEKDKEGYYLYLSGGTHCNTFAVVRMYNELKRREIPVVLREAQAIRDKVLGKDNIGIVSMKDAPWHYWYGGFRDRKVINFDNLAEMNEDTLIKEVNWYPLERYALVE